MQPYTPTSDSLLHTGDEPNVPPLSLPPNPFAHARTTSARPHQDFSTAVDRRARGERRTKPRLTPERRAFASEHLAAPRSGPADDPRPIAPPPAHEHATSPTPIDPIMPQLPIAEAAPALEPARPYELPTRGVAATTRRTTRPDSAITAAIPFPHHLDDPPAPAGAPAPPTGPVTVLAQPAPAGTVGIDAIFGNPAIPAPVGHLQPALTIPEAGPAGPAVAPAAGLVAHAAAASAAPNAWFGGLVQIDDELLVWNAPAAARAPAPGTAPSGIAAAPLAATTTVAATATATTSAPTGRTPGRLALLIACPAALGIAIAFAVSRFLL